MWVNFKQLTWCFCFITSFVFPPSEARANVPSFLLFSETWTWLAGSSWIHRRQSWDPQTCPFLSWLLWFALRWERNRRGLNSGEGKGWLPPTCLGLEPETLQTTPPADPPVPPTCTSLDIWKFQCIISNFQRSFFVFPYFFCVFHIPDCCRTFFPKSCIDTLRLPYMGFAYMVIEPKEIVCHFMWQGRWGRGCQAPAQFPQTS